MFGIRIVSSSFWTVTVLRHLNLFWPNISAAKNDLDLEMILIRHCLLATIKHRNWSGIRDLSIGTKISLWQEAGRHRALSRDKGIW